MITFGTMITTAEGISKPVTTTYDDGAYLCPHCDYPVMADHVVCRNPGCDTNLPANVTKARREQAEKEAAELAQRKHWRQIAYGTAAY
jgi:hypothetical protein